MQATSSDNGTIFALDIGQSRVGIARASVAAGIASPHATFANTDQILEELSRLFEAEKTLAVVVGLPRGMQGQETQQTVEVLAFGERLRQVLEVPLHYQDEALTSVKAERELRARGKPFAKEDVDALAATYILEDFLNDHPEVLS